MRKNIPLLFLMAVITLGCQSTPDSLPPEEYLRWVTSSKRDFYKTRKVKGVEIHARFLPAEYLAYREFVKSSEETSYDSLLKSYQCGLTFQITLQAPPADRHYGSLMQYNVASEPDYKERIHTLNFSMQDFIHVSEDSITYPPALTNFEGYDAVGNKVSFQVVIVIPEFNCGNVKNDFSDLVLTFDDPCWDLGTINFEFAKENFLKTPRIFF